MTIVTILKMVLQDTISLLYCECGGCGIRRFDVMRREGKDQFSELSLRDVYGNLCNDCYETLKHEND